MTHGCMGGCIGLLTPLSYMLYLNDPLTLSHPVKISIVRNTIARPPARSPPPGPPSARRAARSPDRMAGACRNGGNNESHVH